MHLFIFCYYLPHSLEYTFHKGMDFPVLLTTIFPVPRAESGNIKAEQIFVGMNKQTLRQSTWFLT